VRLHESELKDVIDFFLDLFRRYVFYFAHHFEMLSHQKSVVENVMLLAKS
jgi:hypothetical protein